LTDGGLGHAHAVPACPRLLAVFRPGLYSFLYRETNHVGSAKNRPGWISASQRTIPHRDANRTTPDPAGPMQVG
jgi:hypothetical protein